MKKNIYVPLTGTPITLLSGITFARVPYWFPFYNYKDLKLDLLLPFRPEEGEKRPLFVWLCGGGFATMERSAYIPWLTYFAKRGYAAASIVYRLSNSAHFPAQIEDAKKAIRFLRAHAGEFRIDPERIAVGGESAGGNLAAMVGVTNGISAFDVGEYQEQSSRVSAVVNYYGPAALRRKPARQSMDGVPLPETTGDSRTVQLLGFDPETEPERAAKMEAQYYVNENTVPFFLAHGTGDTLVDISGSDAFYEVLTQNKVPVDYYRIQGAGHMGMEFYQEEMSQRILEFLDRML